MGNTASANVTGYSHQDIAKNIERLLKNGSSHNSSINLDSFTLENSTHGHSHANTNNSVVSDLSVTNMIEMRGGGEYAISVPSRDRYSHFEPKSRQQGGAEGTILATPPKINSIFTQVPQPVLGTPPPAKNPSVFSAEFSLGTGPSYSNTSELAGTTISDAELRQLRNMVLNKSQGQMGGCGCAVDENNLQVSETSSQPVDYSVLKGGAQSIAGGAQSIAGGASREQEEKKKAKKEKSESDEDEDEDKNELTLDKDEDDDEFEEEDDDDDEIEVDDAVDELARPKKRKHKRSLARESRHGKNSPTVPSSSSSSFSSDSSVTSSSGSSPSSEDFDFRHRNRLNRLRYEDYMITSQSAGSPDSYVVDAKQFYSSDSGEVYGYDSGHKRNNKLRNRIK